MLAPGRPHRQWWLLLFLFPPQTSIVLTHSKGSGSKLAVLSVLMSFSQVQATVAITQLLLNRGRDKWSENQGKYYANCYRDQC